MQTPAWYKGVSPNFTVNHYLWVNAMGRGYGGTIELYYSERVTKQGKYEKFKENKSTGIADESSIRLCTAEEIAEIKILSGYPTVKNNYSIF